MKLVAQTRKTRQTSSQIFSYPSQDDLRRVESFHSAIRACSDNNQQLASDSTKSLVAVSSIQISLEVTAQTLHCTFWHSCKSSLHFSILFFKKISPSLGLGLQYPRCHSWDYSTQGVTAGRTVSHILRQSRAQGGREARKKFWRHPFTPSNLARDRGRLMQRHTVLPGGSHSIEIMVYTGLPAAPNKLLTTRCKFYTSLL